MLIRFDDLILGLDDSLKRYNIHLARFVLHVGLRLQPRDIRFRLLQLQPRHSHILHLSERQRLRFSTRRPKQLRLIR